jgi:hypothetical protein
MSKYLFSCYLKFKEYLKEWLIINKVYLQIQKSVKYNNNNNNNKNNNKSMIKKLNTYLVWNIFLYEFS